MNGKRFPLSDFQNFLRTQTGNTTTVNIIISTVDYLLRLQVRRAQILCNERHALITNRLFRSPSATFTGTTLAKTSSMTRGNGTSPKLYLSPSRSSTR